MGEEDAVLWEVASCREKCFAQQEFLAQEHCSDLAQAEEQEGSTEALGSSASSGGSEMVASQDTG